MWLRLLPNGTLRRYGLREMKRLKLKLQPCICIYLVILHFTYMYVKAYICCADSVWVHCITCSGFATPFEQAYKRLIDSFITWVPEEQQATYSDVHQGGDSKEVGLLVFLFLFISSFGSLSIETGLEGLFSEWTEQNVLPQVSAMFPITRSCS